MRRLAVWVSGGLLLIAVGAYGGLQAAEPDRPATKTDWYGPTWGRSNSSSKKPAPPKSTKPAEKTEEKTAKPPSKPPSMAAQRAIEEAEYIRRIEVCDRLEQIAEQNNDRELVNLAASLKQRAWTVYQQRTANLTSVHAADVDDGTVLEKGVPQDPVGANLKARGGIPRRAPASESGNSRAALEEIKR